MYTRETLQLFPPHFGSFWAHTTKKAIVLCCEAKQLDLCGNKFCFGHCSYSDSSYFTKVVPLIQCVYLDNGHVFLSVFPKYAYAKKHLLCMWLLDKRRKIPCFQSLLTMLGQTPLNTNKAFKEFSIHPATQSSHLEIKSKYISSIFSIAWVQFAGG